MCAASTWVLCELSLLPRMHTSELCLCEHPRAELLVRVKAPCQAPASHDIVRRSAGQARDLDLESDRLLLAPQEQVRHLPVHGALQHCRALQLLHDHGRSLARGEAELRAALEVRRCVWVRGGLPAGLQGPQRVAARGTAEHAGDLCAHVRPSLLLASRVPAVRAGPGGPGCPLRRRSRATPPHGRCSLPPCGLRPCARPGARRARRRPRGLRPWRGRPWGLRPWRGRPGSRPLAPRADRRGAWRRREASSCARSLGTTSARAPR
mmetsp:Transcript_45953/g.142258  ORF Transcript_45953/g.142258 Transcript_45953/m.142258 type:complete len:265 (+) Transcript_45953:50-844(+)